MKAGYASVAGTVDVAAIHKEQGIEVPSGASAEMCPHASKARAASQLADDLAAASKGKSKADALSPGKAAAAGCPFHAAANQGTSQTTTAQPTPATPIEVFNYDTFYSEQLQKKHDDKSYRYFNNINRLAKKFPMAHTAEPKDEVEVWCSNDYLGMGNNPVVLETMQYAF